jgi:hypothetical protein
MAVKKKGRATHLDTQKARQRAYRDLAALYPNKFRALYEEHRMEMGLGALPSKPAHGTYSGYQAHRRSGEKPCKACYEAAAAYQRAYHRRRRQAAKKKAA